MIDEKEKEAYEVENERLLKLICSRFNLSVRRETEPGYRYPTYKFSLRHCGSGLQVKFWIDYNIFPLIEWRYSTGNPDVYATGLVQNLRFFVHMHQGIDICAHRNGTDVSKREPIGRIPHFDNYNELRMKLDLCC